LQVLEHLFVSIISYQQVIFQPDSHIYVSLAERLKQNGSFNYPEPRGKYNVERLPGYPIFLAIISIVFGGGFLTVVGFQAVLDSFSCVLIYLLAEKVLKSAGYNVRLVAPPPELRKGCDLAVEINLVEQPGIERVLRENDAACVSIVPLKAEPPAVLEIVKVTDFGRWVMVKAANMKLTFDKESGFIVNTSGGGCPDIPSLHAELVGKQLAEAPHPRDLGFTLCALMLERALEESLTIWEGGK